VKTLARKKTKAEALEDLMELNSRSGPATRGLPKRAKMVKDAAFLGAAGLIMLDPLNRLADERIVLPLDMVCIPAYQAYMIQGAPSLQIYVRAGETIVPTGGNVRDVQEAMEEAAEEVALASLNPTKPKRKTTAYQKKYKAAFKSIAPKYKLKNGKWKKGGFKAAVKAAHKKAGGKK
jgi:hypothetical protein